MATKLKTSDLGLLTPKQNAELRDWHMMWVCQVRINKIRRLYEREGRLD
jgi:hypothetical protein